MKLPLANMHVEAGATMLRTDGTEVPGAYGEVAEEVETLHTGCGLVDRSWIDRLELLGADRVRFLNGLTTANLPTLDAGTSREGLLTDGRGRVLADARILALVDRLWLELPPGTGVGVREHLSRFIVADRVEITSIADLVPLSLVGPRAPEVLVACGTEAGSADSHRRARVAGMEVHVESRLLGGHSLETLWVSSALAEMFWADLLESGRAAGLRPVGFLAFEQLRIEAGQPRWGPDFDAASLPQETGRLASTVDFDKGCYLGQEIVARLQYRGKPKRLCVAVEIEGELPLEPEALFDGSGAEVGRLTSVAPGRGGGKQLGIATIRRETVESGETLFVGDRWVRLRSALS